MYNAFLALVAPATMGPYSQH